MRDVMLNATRKTQGCGRVQEEVFLSEIDSKFSFLGFPEMIILAMISLAVRVVLFAG
jgi:hypothetical protein